MMQHLPLVICILSVSLLEIAASSSPVVNLPIMNKVIAPDGFSRSTVLAGGTFPGPLLTSSKGGSFQINVEDHLTDKTMDVATSIHWHGLFQHTTNYDDGPAFVTQCPITPGKSFLYDFNVPNQAGTFWYHSHFQNQYCDGLRGAMVVYDREDPQHHLYDIDNEDTVITLADWYHYLSTNAPPVPNFSSGLINGKGRYPGGPTNIALAVVNVEHGLRYRFRLVSISCDPSFIFSIDGHKLTVIEADGGNVQPLLVDSLEIFAGQRYSTILNANQPISNYWIRSLPNAPNTTSNEGLNSAILRYAGAGTRDPTTLQSPSELPLLETNLHPLTKSPAPGKPEPGGADININLNVVVSQALHAYLVNGVAFEPPSVPVLLQIMSGAKAVSELLPSGSIYGLQLNKVVELVIPGGALGGPHPVHLHGHAFSVVRSAGNSTYNFMNPVVRDVVNIGDTGDEVTIRFITDNPGPWFFHCHIDWHLTAGFAAVFAEDVPDVKITDRPTAAWEDLCPSYNAYVKNSSISR